MNDIELRHVDSFPMLYAGRTRAITHASVIKLSFGCFFEFE